MVKLTSDTGCQCQPFGWMSTAFSAFLLVADSFITVLTCPDLTTPVATLLIWKHNETKTVQRSVRCLGCIIFMSDNMLSSSLPSWSPSLGMAGQTLVTAEPPAREHSTRWWLQGMWKASAWASRLVWWWWHKSEIDLLPAAVTVQQPSSPHTMAAPVLAHRHKASMIHVSFSCSLDWCSVKTTQIYTLKIWN